MTCLRTYCIRKMGVIIAHFRQEHNTHTTETGKFIYNSFFSNTINQEATKVPYIAFLLHSSVHSHSINTAPINSAPRSSSP